MKPEQNAGTRRVTIIDLEVQNILSVQNAFRVIGAEVSVARRPEEVGDDADFMVLPGVGAFGAAASRLEQSGLAAVVLEHARTRQRPLMGMCLGMQLLADESEEYGVHRGLGLVPGRVLRLREQPPEDRVPHIGWREVRPSGHSTIFDAAVGVHAYYHVHSFHLACAEPAHVAGVARFGGEDIACVIHHGNVFGTQFHPEKSQDAGLDLLHTVLHALK